MSDVKGPSRAEQLVKNTFILAIGTFLPKLAAFITLPILTGYLTKEEYGTYDLVTVLVSLLLPTVTCQISISAFRYLIDVRDNKKEQKRIISNIFVFTIITSLAALTITFFAMYKISIVSRVWISLYFLADILVAMFRQIARGIGKSKQYSASAIVSALGKLLFAFLFVKVFSLGIVGAIAALCLASTSSLIYIIIAIKALKLIDFSLLSKKCLKTLLGYSWPLVPNELSLWIMRVSDRVVVTFFLGTAANAVYSVANKIPSIITLAQGAITLAWQENASITSKDDDAKEYYSKMFKVMHNFQAGFLGLVIAATPVLFRLLIKGDYSESYAHIPILCLAIFYASISTYLGGIYVAYKATKSIGVTTVVSAMINIIVNVSLIKFIGIYAASISTLVAYIMLMIYRMINVRKYVELNYEIKEMIAVNAFMICECILCFLNNVYINIVMIPISLFGIYFFNKKTLSLMVKKIENKFSRRH